MQGVIFENRVVEELTTHVPTVIITFCLSNFPLHNVVEETYQVWHRLAHPESMTLSNLTYSLSPQLSTMRLKRPKVIHLEPRKSPKRSHPAPKIRNPKPYTVASSKPYRLCLQTLCARQRLHDVERHRQSRLR